MSEPLWVPIGAVSAVGDELAYAERTSNLTINQTTEALAQAVVTAPDITVDGLTDIFVDCMIPVLQVGANAGGNFAVAVLYDGATSIGKLGDFGWTTNSIIELPFRVSRRLRPSAGTHTYSLRVFRTNADSLVVGGLGGVGNYMPAFIRVSTVRPTGVGAGGAATPACRVRRATSQSLGNGAETAIIFDFEDFDTDGMHDNATNADRITVKTAGKYSFDANLQFAVNNIGSRGIGIKKNGADYLAYTWVPTTPATVPSAIAIHGIFDFAVNDYIQVLGYQNSTTPLNVEYAPYYSPCASMHRIV